ncbi:MAG TPA: Fur family transcriptional regulator [Herpetosiphonaceae bacterium]
MRHQHDIQELRKQGYRLTRQRMLILDLLRSSERHMTADQIYVEVSRHHPEINLATVYRTLQWLHQVGMLRKIDVGKDRLEYEYAHDAEHHHLICKVCGAQTQIDNHVIQTLQDHILEHYGFEADPDHVAIFGRCADCRTVEAQ